MNRRDLLRLAAASTAASLSTRLWAAAPDGAIVGKIELQGRRVVMPVSFGAAGGTVIPFLIDTGTILSLIDDALAQRLRLSRQGSTTLGGIGGSGSFPLYLAKNVVFGGTVRQSAAIFAGRKGGFGDLRGVLAAGILTAADSDLDMEAGEWRLYPQGRSSRAGYVRTTSGFSEARDGGSARIYANAEVNGYSLRFLIDTGAPGALSLHEQAVAKLGLWSGRPYSPQRTSGLGGPGGLGRLVRVRDLAFGGCRFERPVVLLRKDGISQEADGIIGLGLLRAFNLSTDVATRSLWVQPHAAHKPVLDDYNRAGLWMEQKRGGIEVIDVGTGSPAQKAGLKVGDRIAGKFNELVDLISRPAGTAVTLALQQGGSAKAVSFQLEDYL